MMKSVLQDLRYGSRVLLKNPLFTASAVITLVLGIGVNTAIFSVTDAVLFSPLPYKDPSRLMMVWDVYAGLKLSQFWISDAEYFDFQKQGEELEDIAAFKEQIFNLTESGEPERFLGAVATPSIFSTLGVKPLIGQTFYDYDLDKEGDQVAVLAYSLWQSRFSGSRDIIGQKITLNAKPYIVIGVMPPEFELPLNFQYPKQTKVWVPLIIKPNETKRGNHWLNVVARARKGVTVEQVKSSLAVIASRLRQDYPQTYKENLGFTVTAIPLHDQVVGDTRPALLMLLGAVGLVLLIACANVANLLLSKAESRQGEIAIRLALGANRARLVRQLITESILLSLPSGVLGLLLAVWATKLLVSASPGSLPRAESIGIQPVVLIFTIAISIVTGLVFSLAPALQATKPNLTETLKEGAKRTSGGPRRQRVRDLLVVSELALAVVLAIGAGLLVRSFLALQRVNTGFNPENLLTIDLSLPLSQYKEDFQVTAFYQQLLETVGRLPAVTSVSAVSDLPLLRPGNKQSFSVEGQPIDQSAPRPNADMVVISSKYFQTLGIPILQGRDFNEADHDKSTPVIVINQSMANSIWPGEDPLGRRIKLGVDDDPFYSIVGVVSDVKQKALDAQIRPAMFVPYRQTSLTKGLIVRRDLTLVVRTVSEPISVSAAVKEQIRAKDRNLPIGVPRTATQILADSSSQQHFSMLLLAIFACVALTLAAVGIYGVISYSVAQRTHELGIRMALGARPGNILWLVMKHGLTLTIVGVGVGLAGAFGLTKLMSTLLFGVGTTDQVTFVAVSLVLTLVAMAAMFIPAMRATKVNPMIALRSQ